VDILESKFPLHESFCLRNVNKCDCGMMVNIADFDDHFHDFHKIVECSHCKVSMENKEFKVHARKCIEKPVPCQFCQLEVNLSAIKEHEYSCGSKTEQCSNCLKYVQIKDFENHLLHACDPGIKLSNQINIEEIPRGQKKNKAINSSKISAAASLMNNKNGGKRKVKLDSPFSENFQMETVNHHPVSYNKDIFEKKAKDEKKGKRKKENADLKFLKEQKGGLVAREMSDKSVKEENKEKEIVNGVEELEKPAEDIVKKFPYKKAVEEVKEELKMKEDNNNDMQKKKKKKKMKNDYVGHDENDNLAYDDEGIKNKAKKPSKRKISDRSEKYSKKKMSENDFEDANFDQILKTVEKNFYINPQSQENEILKKVLERSKKDK